MQRGIGWAGWVVSCCDAWPCIGTEGRAVAPCKHTVLTSARMAPAPALALRMQPANAYTAGGATPTSCIWAYSASVAVLTG